MVRFLLGGLGIAAVACDDPPCVDMTQSDQGLVVTEAEHGIGWAEPSCNSCHAREATHQRGCTPGVDLGEVRGLVDAEGLDSCAYCHGDNGGEP